MMMHVPEIGGVIAFNQQQKRQKKKRLSIEELIQNKTTLVILHANYGSASHAVVVMDNIILDATQSHAMKLCREESLDLFVGNKELVTLKRHYVLNSLTRHRRGMQGQ
jgi:hypothetical protein